MNISEFINVQFSITNSQPLCVCVFLPDLGTDRFKNLLGAWKTYPAFSRDNFVANPNRKLSSVASDSFDFNAKFFLEYRRHTGSAWSV